MTAHRPRLREMRGAAPGLPRSRSDPERGRDRGGPSRQVRLLSQALPLRRAPAPLHPRLRERADAGGAAGEADRAPAARQPTVFRARAGVAARRSTTRRLGFAPPGSGRRDEAELAGEAHCDQAAARRVVDRAPRVVEAIGAADLLDRVRERLDPAGGLPGPVDVAGAVHDVHLDRPRLRQRRRLRDHRVDGAVQASLRRQARVRTRRAAIRRPRARRRRSGALRD